MTAADQIDRTIAHGFQACIDVRAIFSGGFTL